MLELSITSKAKKSHNKVNQLSPRQRREIARYMPVCWHCGQTKGLLTFKRADGKDITLCKAAAVMAGYIARDEV